MKVTDVKTVVGSERAKAAEGQSPEVGGPKDRVSVQATKAAEATIAARTEGRHW